MSDDMTRLDQALELGARELRCLQEEKVDEAGQLAQLRKEVLLSAEGQSEPDKTELLMDKLLKLQALQGRLTSEAKKLRQTVAGDLKKLRLEGKRMSGYREGAKITPLSSRFISKRG